MGWLNGILPQNAICLTGVNNGILNHLRDMGVVPLLVTSDSANPGQPYAFPFYSWHRVRDPGRLRPTSMPACPVDVDFTFTAGTAGRKGREGGRGNTVRASRAKIASSLDAGRCTCLRSVCATATCKTCKVISRAELRRRQGRGRDAAFLHTGFTVSVPSLAGRKVSPLFLSSLYIYL